MSDLTGKQFANLTVIQRNITRPRTTTFWDCKCRCGQLTTVTGWCLTSGRTKSCGCQRTEWKKLSPNTKRKRETDSRKCKRCKQIKPPNEFANIFHFVCRECYRKNSRVNHYKYKYGVSAEQLVVLQKQKVCAICASPFSKLLKKHLDHSHKTGEIRKLLCRDCNLLLGHAKDSPAILESAIRYLTTPKIEARI